MWLRLLHIIGLTNLTDEQVQTYERSSRSRTGEGVDEPSALPPSSSSGNPDGERRPAPAASGWRFPGDVFRRGVRALPAFVLRDIRRIIVGTIVMVGGGVVLTYLISRDKGTSALMDHSGDEALTECRSRITVIRREAAYGHWRPVLAKIPEWERDCSGRSKELELELRVYKARSELWAGRISGAQVIIDRVRGHLADSSPLRVRVDYVDTVLARASGQFSVAHYYLSDLLPAKRIDPLPDDVLFDVLYDLTVLEMRLDDPSQTKKRLSEVKNATGNDKMRIDRAVLLEGMISYTHGELSECVNLLNKIEFDWHRAPSREGLRLFYLAACLEELGKSDQARKPRNDAKELLFTGGNQWEWLAMRAHKIHRELDGLDRKINRSFYTQDKAGAVAAISQAIEEADADLARLRKPAKDHVSIPTGGPIPWIHLQLKLLEAQLTLLKFKLQKPADEGALRKVSGDIKPLLEQAKTQELVLFQVWCHFALAQLAIIKEDDSKVTSHYQTAKDLAEKAGLPQEAARAMLKRAEFHRQIQCPSSCREDILGAIAIFEKSGNNFWVGKLKDYLKARGCSPPASQDDDREPNSSSTRKHP